MTTVANDKLSLAIQRLGRIQIWFDALSTKSKTDAEARARREDAEAIADVLAALSATQAEVWAWKLKARPFIAACAAALARDAGRPDGELHPEHYDLLASAAARMTGFTRGTP